MIDALIIAAALTIGYAPIVWSYIALRRREVARLAAIPPPVIPSGALSNMGTAARAKETEEAVRLARLARREAHGAWDAAGRPD